MIDELCKMIQDYYAKNTITDSEESTSSNVQIFVKKDDSKNESSEEEDDDDDDEEEKEEESPSKKTTSEVINGDEIYDSFINNKHNVNDIFTKPKYDIVNNLQTFICASNKY
jgi:hypothetical protein